MNCVYRFTYTNWPSYFFRFNSVRQKKFELTVKLQMYDSTYIILMKKKIVHWQGFTAEFAFLACLCLVLAPLTDRLGIWKTNKQKQTDEESLGFCFQFYDCWWVLIFARIRCYLHKMHFVGEIKMLWLQHFHSVKQVRKEEDIWSWQNPIPSKY